MASIPELTQAPRAKEAPGAEDPPVWDSDGAATSVHAAARRARLDLAWTASQLSVPRTQGHRLPARSTSPRPPGPPCPASSPRPTATSARPGRGRRCCWRCRRSSPRSRSASAIVQRGVKPGNDNRPAEQPVAIVTAKKPRGRKAAWTDDGQETPPEIKALIERMMLGRGPGSST